MSARSTQTPRGSSGASCPGLIEAHPKQKRSASGPFGHPGLLAPASLKRLGLWLGLRGHPGLLAPASLKLQHARLNARARSGHPGLLAPASLKPRRGLEAPASCCHGHPGLLAPASLKRGRRRRPSDPWWGSSGASCPGLIEAASSWGGPTTRPNGHPGLLAPASLKHQTPKKVVADPKPVIRGFLPRPH